MPYPTAIFISTVVSFVTSQTIARVNVGYSKVLQNVFVEAQPAALTTTSFDHSKYTGQN